MTGLDLSILLKECRQNRLTAQKYLYESYADKMFLLCRRYLKNDSEAEEAVQNCFLQIFRNLHSFQYTNEAAFTGWIRKIMVNECLQYLRKKSLLLVPAEDNELALPLSEDIFSKLSADEIFRYITSLPTGYRTIFNLFIIEGYTHTEISILLGITEGTSKSQLNKARKLLQQTITQKQQYHAGKKSG